MQMFSFQTQGFVVCREVLAQAGMVHRQRPVPASLTGPILSDLQDIVSVAVHDDAGQPPLTTQRPHIVTLPNF